MEITSSVLLGRSRERAKRYVVLAGAIFLGTLGLMGLVRVSSMQGIAVPISGAWLLWFVAIVVIGVPAVHAYRNDGLVVSLVLGLPVPLAFYLVLTAFDLVYPSEDVLWGIWAALQFGVPAGLLGYLVGAGGRRLHMWQAERRSDRASGR